MDHERQIRFLYPPVVVLAFFSWGFFFDEKGIQLGWWLLNRLDRLSTLGGAVSGIIAGGTIILIVGYLLGTGTYVILRLMFLILDFIHGRRVGEWRFNGNHESWFSESDIRLIWNAVMPANEYRYQEAHCAIVWLDFHSVGKEVHGWLLRRWNAFNVSLNICAGIFLTMSLFICPWSDRATPRGWCLVGVISLIAFLGNAFFAWRETKQMLVFAAKKVSYDKLQEQLRKNTGSVTES